MNKPSLPGRDILNRNALLLLAVWASLGFGYVGLHSVLFNLYLLRLGYGPEFVGTVSSAAMLMMALCSFPAGWLGRRFGSRRVLIAGMVVTLIYTLIPVAPIIPAQLRRPLIVLTMAVFGIAQAAVLVNSMPFLMANVAPEQRNRVFSLRIAAMSLFAFAGSLVAGVLPQHLATRLGVALDDHRAYWISLVAVPIFMALGLVLMLLTKERDEPSPSTDATTTEGRAPIRLLATLAVVNLLVMASYRSTQLFFNVYMDTGLHAPTVLIGISAGAAQLLSVPSVLFMPALARRIGRAQAIVLALTVFCLGQLFLTLIPHWSVAGLCFAAAIAAYFVFNAAFAVHSQELVPKEWRAVTAGTVIAARGVSVSAMVFGGGYLISALGHRPLFLLNAALAAVAAITFLLARSLWPEKNRALP
jgi:MFS family permease